MDGNDGLNLFLGVVAAMVFMLVFGIYGLVEGSSSHHTLWVVFTVVGGLFFFGLLTLGLCYFVSDVLLFNRQLKKKYSK